MGQEKNEPAEKKEKGSVSHENEPNDEMLEQIRKLEEEIRRLKKENKRIEEENKIFKEALKLKGIEPGTLLEERKELLRRVNMNSTNSSKPPSSDGYRKPSPKSLRVKTGRKRGGQPGHEGHNIVLPHDPDEFVDHYPDRCSYCPNFEKCREGSVFNCKERRNVLDLEVKVIVTEHRAYQAQCPCLSGETIRGVFPENVSAYVQYGDSFAIAAGILDSYGQISDKRISEILGSLSGTSISPSTVESLTSRCAKKVKSGIEAIRRKLKKQKVTHHDETGIRLDGKLHWVHNTSTSLLTYQTIQRKRGKEGIDKHGAVPNPDACGVHDCWAPYFGYEGEHALCCAHLLRELTGIEENEPGHGWSTSFKKLLLHMKSLADTARDCGKQSLDPPELERCMDQYDEVMKIADDECPVPQDDHPHTRGKKKKGRERALIERLIRLKDNVCMFVHDLDVPFDNNQAERDLRYIKVKAKVSGGFRSLEKAQEYLDVSSYLLTARKNGIGAFEALQLAFDGKAESILRYRCPSTGRGF